MSKEKLIKIWLAVKEHLNGNIYSYEGLLLVFCFIFIIPYFILSFFDNPSFDDFSFAIKTIDLGYWKAQISAYTLWNGRYFASFVLCGHPLSIGSYILLKFIPLILLFLSIHSMYRFIDSCLGLNNKFICFVLAVTAAFFYLNHMPTLVEGIYWASGAITYHLSNILIVYLGSNIHIIVYKPHKANLLIKTVSAFLIIACCGSNETSMLVTVALLSFVLLYYLTVRKTIQWLFVFYFIIAIICFCVLLSSPGGTIREKDFTDPNTKNVLYTLLNSFSTGSSYLITWLKSLQTIVFSTILLFSFNVFSKSSFKVKESVIYLGLVFILGYLVIVATFSPGFWATARIAPDRAINCSYWLFIIVLSLLLFFAARILSSVFVLFNKINYPVSCILLFSLLLLTSKTSGNYYTACEDLVSGKAFIYNEECKKRLVILERSADSSIVDLPAFSVYPKSLLTGDLSTDDLNWWNREYAKYHHKRGVRIKYVNGCSSRKYFFNLDDENSNMLMNLQSITNTVAFSSPNSSLMPGAESYSSIFNLPISDLNMDYNNAIFKSEIKARIYSENSLINTVMVLCITDAQDKALFWAGKEINRTDYPLNQWMEENFIIPIIQNFDATKQKKISIYMLNKGSGKVYLDDLSIDIQY